MSGTTKASQELEHDILRAVKEISSSSGSAPLGSVLQAVKETHLQHTDDIESVIQLLKSRGELLSVPGGRLKRIK